MQAPLIPLETSQPALPDGFIYEPGFLDEEEEQALLEQIAALEFQDVEMHGVTAKRRVVHVGMRYGYTSRSLVETAGMPDWLQPLLTKAAGRFSVDPAAIAEGLITEYSPGAPIGWHRDAPMFDKVIGISLLAPARFQLRPFPDGKAQSSAKPLELTVAPRSIYLISSHARWRWQHHIPGGKELRYSITLRTLRDGLKQADG